MSLNELYEKANNFENANNLVIEKAKRFITLRNCSFIILTAGKRNEHYNITFCTDISAFKLTVEKAISKSNNNYAVVWIAHNDSIDDILYNIKQESYARLRSLFLVRPYVRYLGIFKIADSGQFALNGFYCDEMMYCARIVIEEISDAISNKKKLYSTLDASSWSEYCNYIPMISPYYKDRYYDNHYDIMNIKQILKEGN